MRHGSVFTPYLQTKGLGEPRARAGSEAGPGAQAASSGPPSRRGEEKEEEKDVGLRRCCRRLLFPWQRNWAVGQILVSAAPWRKEKRSKEQKKKMFLNGHTPTGSVSVQAGVNESPDSCYTTVSRNAYFSSTGLNHVHAVSPKVWNSTPCRSSKSQQCEIKSAEPESVPGQARE